MALETMDLHEVRFGDGGHPLPRAGEYRPHLSGARAGQSRRRSRFCRSLATTTPSSAAASVWCGWKLLSALLPRRITRTSSAKRLRSESPRSSQPALEVLTIIRLLLPTTRAYVDQVCGVDSSHTMGLLQGRHKLIEDAGRLQVPGRPRLYRARRRNSCACSI